MSPMHISKAADNKLPQLYKSIKRWTVSRDKVIIGAASP